MQTIFKTAKKESVYTAWYRRGFNFFPAFRRTGGRVCFISDDWKEMHIRVKLNWTTRNYVGTVFGGSLYGAIDPIYMFQLIKILGDDYVVWDKSATVHYKKPVKGKVYARFLITDDLLADIRQKINEDKRATYHLPCHFEDAEGTIYASFEKVLYIADKSYYKEKSKKA